jgi:hypothetical protein
VDAGENKLIVEHSSRSLDLILVTVVQFERGWSNECSLLGLIKSRVG